MSAKAHGESQSKEWVIEVAALKLINVMIGSLTFE
jgi:hypothetical protein